MAVIENLERAVIGIRLAIRARLEACMAPGIGAGASQDGEEGSTTVEYAIGAVATAGFAGLLLAILKSGVVKGLLQGIIERALSL